MTIELNRFMGVLADAISSVAGPPSIPLRTFDGMDVGKPKLPSALGVWGRYETQFEISREGIRMQSPFSESHPPSIPKAAPNPTYKHDKKKFPEKKKTKHAAWKAVSAVLTNGASRLRGTGDSPSAPVP